MGGIDGDGAFTKRQRKDSKESPSITRYGDANDRNFRCFHIDVTSRSRLSASVSSGLERRSMGPYLLAVKQVKAGWRPRVGIIAFLLVDSVHPRKGLCQRIPINQPIACLSLKMKRMRGAATRLCSNDGAWMSWAFPARKTP